MACGMKENVREKNMGQKRRCRWISALLVWAMLLPQFAFFAPEARASDADVLEIGTVEELMSFAQQSQTDSFEGKTVKLTKDITVNANLLDSEFNVAAENPVEWTPIGKNTIFRGIFDGQGHIISGIYVDGNMGDDGTSTNVWGLFGRTGYSAVVKNVRLVDSYIAGYRAGGIVGDMTSGSNYGEPRTSSIQNCQVIRCSILGGEEAGGIAGTCAYRGTVVNCYSSGQISVTRDSGSVGGILGTAYACNVFNCISNSKLRAEKYTSATALGGIIGATGIDFSAAEAGDASICANDNVFAGQIAYSAPCTDVGLLAGLGDVLSANYNYGITNDTQNAGIGICNSKTVRGDNLTLSALQGSFNEGAITINGTEYESLDAILPERATAVNSLSPVFPYLPMTISSSGHVEFNDNTFPTSPSEEENPRQTVNITKNDVEFRGSAKWDDSLNAFVLTEDRTWQDGSIWFSQVQNDVNFEIELEFYTGNRDGADGLVVAFFADKTRPVEQGEGLGFNGCGGYGVELDTYHNSNRGDPSYNHIALLDGNVSTHRKYANAGTFTEDGKWHKLKIVNKKGTCTVYVDDSEALSYSGIAPKSTFDIGITAATGSWSNRHAVRNIKLTESGLRTYTDQNGTILYGMYTGAVMGYSGNPTNIYIPQSANGTQITSISPNAFSNCTSLKNVFLASTLTEIGENAFPEGVTIWGTYEEPGPDFIDTTRNPYRNYLYGSSGPRSPHTASPMVSLPGGLAIIGGKSVSMSFETLSPVIIPVEVALDRGEGRISSTSTYDKNSKGGITYKYNVSLENVTGIEHTPFEGQTKMISLGYEIAEGREGYFIHYYLDQTPPPAVTDLLGKYEGGNIELGWTSPNAGKTSATYNIYESDSVTGPWTKIGSGNSTVDNQEMLWSARKGVTASQKFYYVTTVDAFGQESSPSNTIAVGFSDITVPTDIILTKPANNSTISGTEVFSASAKDDSGIASYTINVRTEQGTDTEPIHTETWNAPSNGGVSTHAVDFTGLSSGPVYVEIIATDLYGNSASGQFIYAYTLDTVAPPKVTGLSATASTSIITLRWDDFANEDKQDFSHFEVQWAEGSSPSGDSDFIHTQGNVKTLGSNISSVSPDTTYTFRVRAIDVRGNKGEWSDTLTVATISDTQPPVVASMQPSMGRYKDKISLSYSIDDDYGISKVKVMVAQDAGNSAWTEEANIDVNKVGTRVTVNYTLNLADYAEGLLRVRPVAIDFAGNESDQSEAAPFVDYIVDRTAPAAPTLLNAIGNYTSILVTWEKGEEEDLGTYSVFRATSEDGNYTQIASNLKSVDYIDSSVTPGTTYFYKVKVNDQAGNVSAFSNTVESQTSADDVPPEVLSISPSDGYTLGPIHAIKASVSDNIGLRQVQYRYSTTSYDSLTETGSLSISGKSKVVTIPVDIASLAMETGATDFFLEIECTDSSGNRSTAIRRHYHLDWAAPAAPSLTAVPGNFRIDLSWTLTGAGENDLAGFRIYRAEGSNTNFRMIGQRSKTNMSYADTGRAANTDFYYYVEALDENGNVSASNTVGPVRVDDTDTTPPVAKITAPESAMAQTAVNFSGSASTDNVGITSYTWSFGDGQPGQSGAQVTHMYSIPGSYTVTLEVSDAYGNRATAQRPIVIRDYTQTGTVRVLARDENGNSVPNAGIYFDLGTESQQFVAASSSGIATFTLPVGSHKVGGYLDGYLPDKKDVNVTANQTAEITLYMEKKNIVAGNLDVKEMTLDEIIAAGIDIREPANQQVYEFTIQLTYGTYSDKFKVVTNSAGTILSDPKKATITDSSGPRDIVITAAPAPTVTWNGTEVKVPTVVILDLPGTASWLKDFFDVRLTVLNQARDEFFLDECSATLNVPAGLTLLDTNRTSSSPVVSMGTIQGMHQKSAEWILRGDKPGTYNLSADFTSILREFGVTIDAEFLASRPIEVRDAGASGDLVLEVIAENMIVGDTDGALRVGIRNDGTKAYNMVNLDLSSMATLKQRTKMRGFRRVENANLDVLNPGETLYWDYIVPRANWATLTAYESEDFYLMDAAVRALGGDTTLKSEIKEVMPFTFLADRIEITKGSAGSNLPLTYVNLNKDSSTSAQIPDLTITTYRLDENGSYQPASMEVKIEDEYLAEKGSQDGSRVITTGADGTYTLPGYEIDVKFLEDLTSYNIRFMSSRAKPVDLPVNIYGKHGETGSLNARVVEQITGEDGKVTYQTLDDVAVSVPDANQSGVTSNGRVKLKLIKTGEHLVILEKDGYLPIQKTVKFEKDENELVFTMRRDTDPNASVITNVSTSLNDYTCGNHVVFPKGQLDGQVVTFELSKRMAAGDVFDHYVFRVRRGEETLDSVDISGDIGFWYNYEALEPGDVTEFAMVYVRDGSTITTPWVDSNITIAPALTAFGQQRVAMADVFKFIGKPAFEADYEWKEKPLSYDSLGKPSQSKPDNKKYYTGLFKPFDSDDEEGKEAFRQLDDLYMTDGSGKWSMPFDVNYELSGKFTFTAAVKHKTGRSVTHIENAGYSSDLKMFYWQPRSAAKLDFDTSTNFKLKIIARFDKVENDWKWSAEVSIGGSQSAEFPIVDTGLETGVGIYLTVQVSATETATWVLVEEAGFTQEAGWVKLPDGLAPKALTAGAELKGSVGLDVLTKGLFSAGFWLKGGVDLEFAQSRVKVSADFGHEETLLFFIKNEKSLASKDWYIDASENISNVSELMFDEYMLQAQAFSSFSSDAYSVDPGLSQMGLTQRRQGGASPLVTDVFLETVPLLVTLDDGSTLMVYCGKSGDASQPAVLYYSVYRSGTGWSTPSVIDVNGTPDIYPHLVKTAKGALLVWNDFSTALDGYSGSNYDVARVESDLAPKANVAAVEFDTRTGQWGPKTTVDLAAVQGARAINIRPVGTKMEDDSYLLAWISSDTLLAGGSQSDSIAYAVVSKDGTIGDSGVISAPKAYTSKIGLSSLGGKTVLSLICADNSDASDGSLYTSTFVGGSFLAAEKVNAFLSADTDLATSESMLYYLNSGSIYSYDGYNSELMYTLPEGVGSADHLNCGDDGKLAWVTHESGEAKVYVAEVQQDSSMTQPVSVLSDRDGTITDARLIQLGQDSTILYRYNELDSSGSWAHDIVSYTVQDGIDLCVAAEDVTSTGYLIPGATISYFVSAQDLGALGTSRMEVSIAPNRDGTNAISSTIVYAREAGINVTVPTSYAGEPLYLVVRPLNGADIDFSNNSVLLENTFTDLSLPGAAFVGNIDGRNEFVVSVRNEGQLRSDALQIQVSDMDADLENTLLTVPVQSLAPGEFVDVLVSVDSALIPTGHTARFALIGHGEDLNGANDTAYAYVEYPEDGEREPEPLYFTVTLTPGIAAGEPHVETVLDGTNYTLPADTFFTAPENFQFTHWAIEGDQDRAYMPGDKIVISADTVLVAVWEEIEPPKPECTHEWTTPVPTIVKEATCSAPGIRRLDTICDDCGVIVSTESESIPATQEHEYGEWTVTLEPTEKDAGRRERACVNCGALDVETLLPAELPAPTTYTISFDSDGREGVMESGLAYDGVPYYLPSCQFTPNVSELFAGWLVEGTTCQPGDAVTVTSDTTVIALWKACGHTDVKQIPGTLATCQSTGLSDGEFCEDCGAIILAQEVLPKTEHTYGEWVVTREPTTTSTGLRERSCEFCGDKQTEVIDKLDQPAPDDVYYQIDFDANGGLGLMDSLSIKEGDSLILPAPTFAAPAEKEFARWLIDGVAYDQGDTIVVKKDLTVYAVWKQIAAPDVCAHLETTVLAGFAATCSKDGLSDGVLCAICGELLTQQTVLPKIPHTIDYRTTIGAEATCTEPGTEEVITYCTACGEVLDMTESDTPALGHRWGDWVVTVEPTATMTGLEEHRCARCGETEERDVPKVTGYFTVILDTQGGHLPDGMSDRIFTDSEGRLTSLPVPTRAGYQFAGWYMDVGGEKYPVSVGTILYTGVVLYAMWSPIPVTTPDTTPWRPPVTEPSGGSNNTTHTTDKDKDKDPSETPDSSKPTVPADIQMTFLDVDSQSWYYEAISFVFSKGIMKGTGERVFAPNEHLTRAMMAQLLFNYEVPTDGTTLPSPFADVPDDAWFAKAVNWVQGAKIMEGYGDRLFGPNDHITREQVAVILWRYAGQPMAKSAPYFTDGPEISTYAREAICWCAEKGILTGYEDGTVRPKGEITRAEIAAVLMRYLER